jgi:ADP-ribosyl-[dinitrogen reductase] hydrolase
VACDRAEAWIAKVVHLIARDCSRENQMYSIRLSNVPDAVVPFRGVILDTAVGDAIGLPREGLSRRRAARMFGGPPLGHRLILGRGMVSDDTEHTCMTAQALLASGGDPAKFARSLAWRLRWWFLGLPAGVGMATAKACIKLWLGFPPSRSGVWSAGNGPAMRAAILGVYSSDNLEKLGALVKASTRLTQSDPAAESGAMAIALAAAYAVQERRKAVPMVARDYLQFIGPRLSGTRMLELIERVIEQLESGATLEAYLQSHGMGNGISGYINHTVPACLFCWLRWPTDFRTAVEQIVIASGDADSTGAIVGALAGITAGGQSIPSEWLSRLIEWPRNTEWMQSLADQLADAVNADQSGHSASGILWPAVLARNVFFLAIVLAHGFRRILPPY